MTETTQGSLNVRLAKWAGYSVRHYKDFNGVEHWDLLNANGEPSAIREDAFDTYPAHSEAEAWQHTPDYAGSLDAGMALVPDEVKVYFDEDIETWRTYRHHECQLYDADGEDLAYSRAPTRALALAYALDAMRQQEEEAGR